MEPMELTPVPSRRGPRREGARAGGKRHHETPQSLTPNNDGDERQMLRRQSAAKVMRKSLGGAGLPGVASGPANRQGMAAAELQAMYENVIRLTAENKITRNNVWELDLICHMPAIVRDYSLVGRDFNFQRASCGLDAGVNIYSKRVDSVHETAEALAGFGVKGAHDSLGDDGDADGVRDQDGEDAPGPGAEQPGRAKGSRRKGGADAYLDPSSTLADAASLRAKEQEVTFDADPLFGKTSRLFDESSAAGLLMLNMGVWADCEIMFESSQVPSAHFPFPSEQQEEPEVQVDLSCLQGLQQLLAAAAQPCFRITPSIELLYEQLGPQGQGSWGEGEGSLPDIAQIMTAAIAEEARSRRFYAPAAGRAAPAPGASASAVRHGSQGLDTSGVEGMEGVEGVEGIEDVQGGAEEGGAEEGGPASPGGWVSDGAPDTGFGDEVEGMEMEGAAAGDEGDGGQEGAAQGQGQGRFVLDEDGFVAGVAGGDEDGDEAGGAGAQYEGGGGSDGEGEEEGEGAEGPSGVAEWLVNQAKSLLASQQPAAPLRGAGFFRYAVAKQGAQGAAAVAKKAAPRKGKSKTAGAPPRLDSDDEDPELEARMAEKGRPEETQLCRRSRAKTLLPAAAAAAAPCSSQRLFTLLDTAFGPLDILSIWRSHAAAAGAEAAAARRGRAARDVRAEGGGGGEEGGYADQGFGDDGGYGFPEGEEDEAAAQAGAEAEASSHALMQAAADAAAAAGLLAPGGLQLGLGFDGLQQPEGFLGLLPAPRKVQKIEVTYDKVAKVVDVKLLKEVLHSSIRGQLQVKREGAGDEQQQPVELAFQEIMSGLQGGGSQGGEAGDAGGGAAPGASTAAQFKDLSVHLCFICLLHLANEHGLQLSNHGQLDQLSVCSPGALPQPSQH